MPIHPIMPVSCRHLTGSEACIDRKSAILTYIRLKQNIGLCWLSALSAGRLENCWQPAQVHLYHGSSEGSQSLSFVRSHFILGSHISANVCIVSITVLQLYMIGVGVLIAGFESRSFDRKSEYGILDIDAWWEKAVPSGLSFAFFYL